MGYSLQRPGAPVEPKKSLFPGLSKKFQWATHFNAQAHRTDGDPMQIKFNGWFQWTTHVQRPRARSSVRPERQDHRPAIVSMGYSLKPQAHLNDTMGSEVTITAFQKATPFKRPGTRLKDPLR